MKCPICQAEMQEPVKDSSVPLEQLYLCDLNPSHPYDAIYCKLDGTPLDTDQIRMLEEASPRKTIDVNPNNL
jgi:hypothetical protein